jgi:hypothetical protein
MTELLQKMQVLTESKRRAGVIVRGLTDSGSGWYDSPDDLEVVIASEIDAAAACATERLTAELAARAEERDGLAAALETHEIGMRQITRRLLGWTEAFPSAEAFQDCRSIVNDCKACMESRTILAARDARNKAEGRAEGLREAANELTPAIPSPIGPLHAAGMMFCVEHLRKMAAQAEGKNHA